MSTFETRGVCRFSASLRAVAKWRASWDDTVPKSAPDDVFNGMRAQTLDAAPRGLSSTHQDQLNTDLLQLLRGRRALQGSSLITRRPNKYASIE
jgi:hypothetical protein